MRIVFMGTPDFAEASLRKLIEERFEVVGVFTQPDKPRGRGMELAFSPVKELALKAGLPVFQPEKLRDGTALAQIRELRPDILVVVAYGRILPDEILAAAPFGAVNVHGSLLPKYRGAAPIQWAVLNGDEKTGVTTMYLAHEMDSGDLIYSCETPIGEKETAGELFGRLKELGASLLVRTLRDIEAGTAPRTPQNHAEASYVSMLDKSLSPIDWNRPPRLVMKQIFGLQPWPVATTVLQGKTLRVFDADPGRSACGAEPGTVVSTGERGVEVSCSGGTVFLTELQAPGKKRMRAADYLRGHAIREGERCE
ncbi:MAG: methionyl-tRNA formyltransferase [Oscillospiraceae bacterium]|nr:methionyl-tRNA formyltransferase [Oscillospiraceae bacterium]